MTAAWVMVVFFALRDGSHGTMIFDHRFQTEAACRDFGDYLTQRTGWGYACAPSEET